MPGVNAGQTIFYTDGMDWADNLAVTVAQASECAGAFSGKKLTGGFTGLYAFIVMLFLLGIAVAPAMNNGFFRFDASGLNSQNGA